MLGVVGRRPTTRQIYAGSTSADSWSPAVEDGPNGSRRAIRGRRGRVRPVKATLFGLLVLALGVIWSNRTFVTEAYTLGGPSADSVRFDGVDLVVPRTEMGPSPYEIAAAPDVRRAAVPTLDATRRTEPVEVALDGGEAVLRGTVTGPEGPVFPGVVRIERHTDAGVGTIDVGIREDGTWSRRHLPGGRYRVRAFVPGRLTMTRSEVLFLDADGRADIDFIIGPVDPQPLVELVDAGPMYDGLTGMVAVTLGQRTIDADGRVLIQPITDATVDAITGPEVAVLSGPTGITDDQRCGALPAAVRDHRVGPDHRALRRAAVELRPASVSPQPRTRSARPGATAHGRAGPDRSRRHQHPGPDPLTHPRRCWRW